MRLQGYLRLFFFLLVGGCSTNKSDESFNVFTSNFDFDTSTQGWTGDFADYRDSIKSALKFEYTKLSLTQSPTSQKSLKLTGNNQGDNLFLFIKGKATDLKPNTEYTLVFEVQLLFESEIGKASGDVYLKVGATTQEPKKIMEGDYHRINLDKGTSSTSGKDMVVIGSVQADSLGIQNYSINQSSLGYNTNPSIRAKTNDNGELWLIIGADSYIQGKTTIYYTSANVVYSVSN